MKLSPEFLEILANALTAETFRKALLERRLSFLGDQGFRLSEPERNVLRLLPEEVWSLLHECQNQTFFMNCPFGNKHYQMSALYLLGKSRTHAPGSMPPNSG